MGSRIKRSVGWKEGGKKKKEGKEVRAMMTCSGGRGGMEEESLRKIKVKITF